MYAYRSFNLFHNAYRSFHFVTPTNFLHGMYMFSCNQSSKHSARFKCLRDSSAYDRGIICCLALLYTENRDCWQIFFLQKKYILPHMWYYPEKVLSWSGTTESKCFEGSKKMKKDVHSYEQIFCRSSTMIRSTSSLTWNINVCFIRMRSTVQASSIDKTTRSIASNKPWQQIENLLCLKSII